MNNILLTFKEKDKRLQTFYLIFFTSLSAGLSFFEYLVPKPFPWFKIGLANCITLAFVFCKNYKEAFYISLFRPVVVSFFTGSIFSIGFIFSFCGSIVSVFFMIISHRLFHRFFSYIGISLIGACSHSITQIIIAYFIGILISLKSIFLFGGIFLLISIIGAVITGYIASKLVEKL